jgi:hypothetical protein
MRVISLWQPWAELVVRGLKQYETRSWKLDASAIGKTYAIHASKKAYQPGQYSQDFRTQMLMDGVDSYSFSYGCVLGVVDIVECITTEEIVRKLSLREQLYGDFGAGRFAWRCENARRFPKPIEMTGRQGIFHWAAGEQALADLY